MNIAMILLEQVTVSEQDVVTPFEQNLLVAMVFVIMFGLGSGLTPRDFRLAIRRPWGLIIGWVTQFGIMPLLAFTLIATLLFQLPMEYAAPVALGALLMGSVPAGTTSNIFAYFSKGNLALSVIMTTNSTIWALLMTPLVLTFYGMLLFADDEQFQIPITNIVATLFLLLIPVVFGMLLREIQREHWRIPRAYGWLFWAVFHSVPARDLGSKELGITGRYSVANIRSSHWSRALWNSNRFWVG